MDGVVPINHHRYQQSLLQRHAARKPTRDIGKKIRSADQGFDISYYGDPRFIGLGGGMPVIVNGECPPERWPSAA
jgi:hypothetical protein